MRIPIANALYNNKINIKKIIKNKNKINFNMFSDLNFENIDKKKFPIVTLLNEKIYKETLNRFDASTKSIFNILNSKDLNKSLRGKKLRKIFDVRSK